MTAVDLKLNARRKPNFKLPPLSCDAHCHVFGPGEKFPYAPGRRYTPADAPKETLAALHDFLGIERAVIVHASAHGTDNRALTDALRWAPERFRGICNADDSFTDRDFQKLHDAGVRGVRFNFVKHLGGAPDMHMFWRVLERVSPLGWHVVLHMDAVDIERIKEEVIGKLALPFVIDHMGRVPSADGIEQPGFQAASRSCPPRRLLDQSQRLRAHFVSALWRGASVCTRSRRGKSGPLPLGYGFPAPESDARSG